MPGRATVGYGSRHAAPLRGASDPVGIGSQASSVLAQLLADSRNCVGDATLDLAWHSIGLEGARNLAEGLRGNGKVTSLNLSCNSIGDGGALPLAAAIRAPGTALRSLQLAQNRLGDPAAIALADMLQANATVEELALNGNEIGNEGASALATAIQRNVTLRRLWIADNCIGDAGTDAIAAAAQPAAKAEQLTVLWLGKQRAPARPSALSTPGPAWGAVKVVPVYQRHASTTAHRTAPDRVGTTIAMLQRQQEQELSRREAEGESAAASYGVVLAESLDSDFSRYAQLEQEIARLRVSHDRLEGASAAAAAATRESGTKSARLAKGVEHRFNRAPWDGVPSWNAVDGKPTALPIEPAAAVVKPEMLQR